MDKTTTFFHFQKTCLYLHSQRGQRKTSRIVDELGAPKFFSAQFPKRVARRHRSFITHESRESGKKKNFSRLCVYVWCTFFQRSEVSGNCSEYIYAEFALRLICHADVARGSVFPFFARSSENAKFSNRIFDACAVARISGFGWMKCEVMGAVVGWQ